MRYLILGGCSFIGAAAVGAAVASGAQVLNFDPRPKSRPHPALAPLAGRRGYVQFEGDPSDRRLVRAAAREFQPDAVLHLVEAAGADPCDVYEAGIASVAAAMEAARAAGDRRAADRGPVRVVLHQPAYPPASASRAGEARAGAAAAAMAAFAVHWAPVHGAAAVFTTSGEAFGPDPGGARLFNRILAAAASGAPVELADAGEGVRDWLAVEDLAAGLLAAAGRGAPGQVYGFSACVERRDLEFAEAVAALLDVHAPRADRRPHAHAIVRLRGAGPRPARPAPIDPSAAEGGLGWSAHPFHTRLADAVRAELGLVAGPAGARAA